MNGQQCALLQLFQTRRSRMSRPFDSHRAATKEEPVTLICGKLVLIDLTFSTAGRPYCLRLSVREVIHDQTRNLVDQIMAPQAFDGPDPRISQPETVSFRN